MRISDWSSDVCSSDLDQFLNIYARYIDGGFGLLGGEVASLSATLIVIDVTLAGLFWAMGGADDVIARLIKKVLYVGAFAFILGNFNALAGIVFRSRSEEHTSELQSLMRNSYAVFCLIKKKQTESL